MSQAKSWEDGCGWLRKHALAGDLQVISDRLFLFVGSFVISLHFVRKTYSSFACFLWISWMFFFKLCQTPNTLEFCTVCIPRNQVQHGTERVYNINIESPKLSPDVPLFHVQFLFALRQHWTSHTFSIQGPLFSIYTYIHIHTLYIHIHIFIYIYTYFGRAISRNVFDFPINSSAFGGWICKAMNKSRQTSKKRTMTYFWGMDDGSIFGGWMMDLMFLLIPKKI